MQSKSGTFGHHCMKSGSLLHHVVNDVQLHTINLNIYIFFNDVDNLTSILVHYNVALVSPNFNVFGNVFKQMNAGAVMLTDCIYWLIIFPFLTLRDYDFNFVSRNLLKIVILHAFFFLSLC